VILSSTDIRTALALRSRGVPLRRQRGFIIDPFKFAVAGGGTDPDFANVSLLLHMNGSNGSTTFTDSSSYGHSITVSGNAQISTAQSLFNGSSGLFDGSGDYLTAPSSAAFTFGTGDLTIEHFMRPGSWSGGGVIRFIYSWATDWGLYVADNDDRMLLFNGSSNLMQPSSGGTNNTWTHVALTRASGVFTLWVGGVSKGTVSNSTNFTSTNFRFGARQNGASAINSGHCAELRVTKGVARYTAGFTPPTAAFPNS
jgi:hypothetical protein